MLIAGEASEPHRCVSWPRTLRRRAICPGYGECGSELTRTYGRDDTSVEWKRWYRMLRTMILKQERPAMPLLRFDLIEGRPESKIREILDVTHEVLLETLKVPKRDRYQVVHEHKRSRMVVEDTGLGFVRSDNVLLLQVTSRPRSREMKENFYRLLVERLASRCGIVPDDVIVNFVTNADEDWSFGAGRAQFLTGELSTGAQGKARIGSPA